MLIAIVNGQTVEQVGNYQVLFPNTSFPSNGPNADFFIQYSCLPVCVYLPFDSSTQELQPTDPYIQDGKVYTVKVVALTKSVAQTTISETISLNTASETITI